jgi:hypothetical protein
MTNEEARRTYITCMQMHADLCLLLGGKSIEFKLPKEEPARRRKSAPVVSTVPADEVAAAMC